MQSGVQDLTKLALANKIAALVFTPEQTSAKFVLARGDIVELSISESAQHPNVTLYFQSAAPLQHNIKSLIQQQRAFTILAGDRKFKCELKPQ